MTLILKSTAEQEWLDKNADQKLEAVKEFGSGVTIREPRDAQAAVDLALHFKPAILEDLHRQVKLSYGVSSAAPMCLHLQALDRKDKVIDSLGREVMFRRGVTVETLFNELLYELPALIKSGRFGRALRRKVIPNGGSLRIRVTLGLLFNQTTVKKELLRVANQAMPQPAAIEHLVAANKDEPAPPKDETH